MNRPRFACGASAAAIALACAPAFAEPDPADQTITVTGQRADDPDTRPGGADSVSAEDYENREAVSLRDALAFSPGIYAQPRFGQEVRLSIRGSGISRGYHMRGITLLLDGVPINLADDNGDFQELDPALLARLDVYRGANALRLGGSTLGGAINGVSPTGRTAPGIAVRVDGGSFDTIRAGASAGFANARGDAWIGVSADRSDGDRDHARRSALRLSGNIGIKFSPLVESRFYALVSHIRQDLPGSLNLDQALATPELSLPNNIANDQARNVDSLRLQSRTTVDLGDATVAFGAFYNAKQLFHPIYQVIDQKSEDRGVFASVDWSGHLGAMPVSVTVGTQARFGTVAAKQYVNLAGKRGALTADVTQRAHTINTYGELRLTPLPRLTLIAGGIHSDARRDIDNRLISVNNAIRGYDGFSPKFGLLWAPIEGAQVYANYSRSVEFPGFGELGQAPTTGFVDVAPQRAWTAEIGTRGSRGIAAWDVSLYRADIIGEMLQFTTGPGIPASTFNAAKTRHQGVEASLDLVLLPWAKLRQVWLYSDFRFVGDMQYGDNRLPVVPKNLYRAEVRLGTDRLSITPRLEWIPDGAWADYRNTVRVPGYALIGLGGEARLGTAFTLFVDARNLTAKRAVGDISASILATPASVAFYPVERRAVFAGFRARF